jgi:shikimate kinase
MIGSGKTAIGERLAARLGRVFYDLDWELDRGLGYSFHRLGLAGLSGAGIRSL